MSPRRQLVTSDEARPSKRQHRKPCSDCPWRRASLRGWVGSATPEAWIQAAHGEERIDCHTIEGPQCAGAATYRANVGKLPRDSSLLTLPRNTTTVFGGRDEFLEHHSLAKGRP